MNSPIEERLREALTEAGAVIEPETLRPLRSASTSASGARPADVRWRVPWLRLRWVASVAAVLAVAGGGTAVLLTGPGGDSDIVAAAAQRSAREGWADLSVFLCGESSPMASCKGKVITADQRDRIRQALDEAPGVKSVVFEDQRAAYKNFMAANFSDSIKKAVRESDMPESFRVTFVTGTSYEGLVTEIKAMPGVSEVMDTGLHFRRVSVGVPAEWPQERVISVFMCRNGSTEPVCGAVPAQGDKAAKPGKRPGLEVYTKVGKILKSLPGVESVIFENAAAALRAREDAGMAEGLGLDEINESFRVLVSPDVGTRSVVQRLGSLPGVESVVDHCPLVAKSC
ncbi:permease-like cell division protein FtsX [Nonomuraea typhae]|uniref:permease-like cell division protein FtsX n=1 Tax=Nonomuraea typhae TaxID=2603600 RepID=UPI0012F8CB4F|nr:permease-like cell division protein FtsX [Nonomuraea typhae]